MNNKLYAQIADLYNSEFGIKIGIHEDRNSPLTPAIDLDLQEVIFNPHFETLMTLFNLSTLHKLAGSRAVHHFLLYHLALRRHLYDKAAELLDLLEADIQVLCKEVEKGQRQMFAFLSEFQTAFILAHEFSHIFYYLHPDRLRENRRQQKEHLVWLRKELDTDKPLLVRLFHFLVPQIKHVQTHSFDEAIESAALQEELLCDEAAWRLTCHFIRSTVTDGEMQALLSAYVVYTLYYIEAQRTLENIYWEDVAGKRQKDLMFDTSRSTVLVNTMWDDVPKENIKQYQSLVNEISRQGRFVLIWALRNNVDHIGFIRWMEKGTYSVKELQRLHAKYEEVVLKLGF